MVTNRAELLNRVIENRRESARLTGFRTLANMDAAGRVRGTTRSSFEWVVDVGGAEAEWTADADQATTDNTPSDNRKASIAFSSYRLRHRFTILKKDMNDALNLGIDELQDLFGTATDEAINAILRKLNRHIWLGDSTSTYGGLLGFSKVADNSSTYAGLTAVPGVVDNPEIPLWRVIRLTHQSRTITPAAALDGRVHSISIGGVVVATYTSATGQTAKQVLDGLAASLEANRPDLGRLEVPTGTPSDAPLRLFRPELAVTGVQVTVGSLTATLRDFNRDLMLDLDQLVQDAETSYDYVTMNPITAKHYVKEWEDVANGLSLPVAGAEAGLKTADLGFGGKAFSTLPIAEDRDVPNGTIWTMDMSKIELLVYQLPQNPNEQGMDEGVLAVNTSYGIPIYIMEHNLNHPLKRTFELFVIPQLKVRSRKAIQVIDNLNARHVLV